MRRVGCVLAAMASACLGTACGTGAEMAETKSGRSDVWIVERDMPQTRNLVPVLNRTTLVAAGAGEAFEASVGWEVAERQVEAGPFWPNFGQKALMSTPVVIPEGFPCREPDVLGEPEAKRTGRTVLLEWAGLKLSEGKGVAVRADVLLGPPDFFHTDRGLRFGDIEVRTDYRVAREKDGRCRVVCGIEIMNGRDAKAVEGLEFAFFFPRALLDKTTGGEAALLEGFDYDARGFADARPLDLLISDGLGRAAWGPRCAILRDRLEPGEKVACSFEATGRAKAAEGDGEVVIVPLISLVARVASRYWPSSVVEIKPPGKTHYSDYTHFNIVVADSRLFRIAAGGEARKVGAGASVEPSGPLVRQSLR